MEPLSLSLKERRRLDVLGQVRDGGLSVAEAARLLGVSERQAWRLKRRYATRGDAGLAHGPLPCNDTATTDSSHGHCQFNGVTPADVPSVP